jgi:hypothetical protein
VLPRNGASQLQIGNIGACDKQNRSHRGQKYKEWSPIVAGKMALQRFNDHRPALCDHGHIRMIGGSTARLHEGPHLCLRLLDAHSGTQTAYGIQHEKRLGYNGFTLEYSRA